MWIKCVFSFTTSPPVPVKVHRKRPGAQWEEPPPPRVHGEPTQSPVAENGPPESYFALQYEQQQPPDARMESDPALSPSPVHSLDADLDIPMETDIDDFQEDEGPPAEDAPITSELPCFALPVTVLETDIDTLADAEAAAPGAGRDSPGAEPESSRESLEELFPQGNEGESWRGAEPNTDSLDR